MGYFVNDIIVDFFSFFRSLFIFNNLSFMLIIMFMNIIDIFIFIYKKRNLWGE